MRPRDFILNSDYLTLANVENRTYTASVSGVIPSNGLYTATFDFACKNSPQTITRAYMHHSKWQNQNAWGVGRFGDTTWEDGNNAFYERMFVSTPSDNTIRLSVEIQGTVGATIPTHEIIVKVFRFKVPNVF